jgi:hypothetical protein
MITAAFLIVLTPVAYLTGFASGWRKSCRAHDWFIPDSIGAFRRN